MDPETVYYETVDGYRYQIRMKIADYSVIDYCNNMTAELAVCRSKMFELVRILEKTLASASTNDVPNVNVKELHLLLDEIAELSERIEQLRTKRPVFWKPEKTEIERKLVHVGRRIEAEMVAIAAGDAGG